MTTTITHPLTRDEFKAAVRLFKATVNSKDAKPTYDSYGTKYQGCVRFEHFAFYALMRGKALDTITHNTESERFLNLKSALSKVSDKGWAHFEETDLLPSFSRTFGLSQGQVKEVIQNELK